MVSVSACVSLPLHHIVQKFSSGTGSPGWSRKKGRKTVVVFPGEPGSVGYVLVFSLCSFWVRTIGISGTGFQGLDGLPATQPAVTKPRRKPVSKHCKCFD